MKTFFRLLLLVVLTAAVSCEKETPTPPVGGNINQRVHNHLSQNYLWNEEYKELALTDVELELNYRRFLSARLLALTTNTLDKKRGQNGDWKLYSYINRTSSSSRAVSHGLEKTQIYGFGFRDFQYAMIDNVPVLVVIAVFPDSPASKAGITRGMAFRKMNGQDISDSNVNSYYSGLLRPGSAGRVATLVTNEKEPQTFEITSEITYENPVLIAEVIEHEGHKIGYLTYDSFEAAYDDDVLAAFRKFKTAGVKDVVLDLRLNGGGYVISANMISCCLAGSAGHGKVLQYYRYNDDRMADPEGTSMQVLLPYDPNTKMFYENFDYYYFGEDLNSFSLDLPRLYVIGSYNTASASELVIGALRGINIPVYLIGERTNGKNVGMETATMRVGGEQYLLAPITFQGYNAKAETVDPAGIVPDYAVSDWNSGYLNFGDPNEPCFAAVLSHITTGSFMSATPTRSGSSSTRLPLWGGPERLEGMIVLPRE